jgi:ADP-L-glycero-D-manno-heptose 6-epimerase
MIVVTGGAGLIGFNIVQALNQQGISNIIIVDNINHEEKKKNLAQLKYELYFDKSEFLNQLQSLKNITTIFHQGACSSTTETNIEYLQQNNVTYSKTLLDYAVNNNCAFIYASSASVYGNGDNGFDDTSNDYFPINGYAQSKLDFDLYVTKLLNEKEIKSRIIGLRYFNVYGYGEAHKMHMSSVIYKFYKTYKQGNPIELFEGSDLIRRDFISVDDVVKINLTCAQQPIENGIYNVGTGKAASFQDLADAFVSFHKNAIIKYIPFPEHLKGKYQYFTQAKMDKWNKQNNGFVFQDINTGVYNYLKKLESE